MRVKFFGIIIIYFLLIAVLPVWAQNDTLSIELVKSKLEKAAKLVEGEGEAAFPKLRDKNGDFWIAGGKGYVWVQSLEGTMLMHPVRPELEGRDVSTLKDATGFCLGTAMNDLVKKHGQGWIVYSWIRPDKPAKMIASYVKLVARGNKNYVLGCGMTSATKEYIQSIYPNDTVIFSEEIK